MVSCKQPTTQRRHEIVRTKVNYFSAVKIEGMRPDFDEVVKRVSEETGYSEIYIKKILKS